MVVGARSGRGEPEDREPTSGDSRHEGEAPLGRQNPDAGAETSEEASAANDRDGGGKKKQQRSFWKELPLLIVIALVLAWLIKTFLLQAFSIPSASMEDTLKIGDRVVVDKLTPWFGSEPERGEVVVFHDPGGWLGETAPVQTNPVTDAVRKGLSFVGLMPSAEEKDLIKRVIAVGGDTVECKGTGPVKVNGKALDEPYIYPGNTPCGDRPFGPIKVPEGRIWVMGDHRQDSLDSRYHQDLPGKGTVSVDEVVGRAVAVVWPIGNWATLPVPSTFDQPGINSAAAAAPAAGLPAAGGLAGAVPLVMWRRRRLLKP
ncbi:signal peptidase I [Actinacidiphila sp. bgisy167]|uniref:signal peptidase I n=1 Tax=Actinacidiphila sp. bgisy167 TaxID=3413797 RepID=UPI003D7541E5